MSESKSYAALRSKLLQPGDRIDRIENIIESGTPDINFCSEGVECWIEQKDPTEPKRSSTRLFGSNHKLSQEQKNWFLEQKNAGGRGYVLITTDKRWLLIDGCVHADFINDMTVQELCDISLWQAMKPIRGREKWMELRKILQK